MSYISYSCAERHFQVQNSHTGALGIQKPISLNENVKMSQVVVLYAFHPSILEAVAGKAIVIIYRMNSRTARATHRNPENQEGGK